MVQLCHFIGQVGCLVGRVGKGLLDARPRLKLTRPEQVPLQGRHAHLELELKEGVE
jgi:hypothetical protein